MTERTPAQPSDLPDLLSYRAVRILPSALALATALGCTVDSLDLEGRECAPDTQACLDGWTCDVARNVCVRDEPGDGGVDAGRDGSVDAPIDAGEDAEPTDVGTDASDASDLDAGPGDAGADVPIDVPVDATPARSTQCDSLSVLFCEGFEDDLSAWSLNVPSGSTTRVELGTEAFRGRGVLYSYVDGTINYSVLYRRVWDDSATDLWVRMLYRIPSGLAPGMEILEMFNTGYDYNVPYLVASGSYADLHSHGIFGGTSWGSSIVTGTDEWICAELHMHRHPTNGYVELFLDGAMAVRTPDMPITQPFNEIGVGMVYAEGEGAVYIDEVMANDSRVPCP